MPKWWAISWMTVIATSSTTSSSRFADVEQGVAIDRDRVGQRTGVPGVAFGQRDALIQPQAVGLIRVAALDEHDDVVDRRGKVGRNQIQCVGHQLLKPLRAHPHGHRATPRAGVE